MSDQRPMPFVVRVFENSACEYHFVGGPAKATDYIVHGTLRYQIRVTWKEGGLLLFATRLGEWQRSIMK